MHRLGGLTTFEAVALPESPIALGEDPDGEQEVGGGVGGDGFAEAVGALYGERVGRTGYDAGEPESAVHETECGR